MTIIAACMMAVCIITATVLMHLINLVLQDQTQQYLGEISNQCRATIEKQIEGDLLTVQAASAFFDETLDEETIVSRLQAENNRNPFVRMAFVNRDYQATIVDLDGSIYLGQDVSDQPVVQHAMAGELSLSDIGSDRFSADDVVIYATPVTNNAQEIIGVMTASRKVDSFSAIIQQPLFGTHGLNLVVRQNGDIVLAVDDILQQKANFFDEIAFDGVTYQALQQAVQSGSSYTFSFTDDGQKYWGTLGPLSYNDWYLVSVVPASYINQGYRQMMFVFVATTLLLILVFTFLLLYTSHIRYASTHKIEHLAYYDDITGTYNTNKFMELAAEQLSRDKNYTLVLLDLH